MVVEEESSKNNQSRKYYKVFWLNVACFKPILIVTCFKTLLLVFDDRQFGLASLAWKQKK